MYTDKVLKYIKYFKNCYKGPPEIDDKWPNIQIDRYSQLLIANNCQLSLENAFQFSLSSFRKGINELVSRKETIDISGVSCLQFVGALCESVLIVGAPGIGKTSLVRQLCLEWAQGSCYSIMK